MRLLPLVVVPVLLCATLTASAASPMVKGKPTRSDICGDCHRDIYRMWQRSAHAKAMEDPIFLDAYRQTEQREGAPVARICLGCHAPAAGILSDYDLKQKVTWEGVNCDICHGITKVELGEQEPKLTFDLGLVKRGPIRDAASGAHQVAFSELHTTAMICAGCHEYANREGARIISTYSEWQQSSAAAAGRTCQSCHMGIMQAAVVDPKVLRDPLLEVNLHEVPGGHSIDQLNKALTVTVNAEHAGGKLLLAVTLDNRGAGHSVPTGMPSRRVRLDVKVRTSDQRSFQAERVYTESFKDASGALIQEDSRYFSKGVALVEDTRIKSDELRREEFLFDVAPQATAYVSIRLNYEHSPAGTKTDRTFITFYSADKTVAPETTGGR